MNTCTGTVIILCCVWEDWLKVNTYVGVCMGGLVEHLYGYLVLCLGVPSEDEHLYR